MTAHLAGSARPDPTMVLLKEIHHRVASELQCLLGALAPTGRPHARGDRLEGAVARIRHIAGIHRSIYEAPSSPSFARHCRDLCTEVVGALGRSDVAVHLDFAADPPREQKLAVALLCVELVTNALKHGPSGDGPCFVRLELARMPCGRLRLIASDSARAPVPVPLRTSAIVRLIADGLGGRVDVAGDDGYVATVTLPPRLGPRRALARCPAQRAG